MKIPDHIIEFLRNLREEIILAFESLEPTCKFQRQNWDHHSGGGGEISLLRGEVFEKAAVNWSHVFGDQFPLDSHKGPFAATGVSLITHMANPHAPTVHMNVRYIMTEKEAWFGGGYDLTPMGFAYESDTEHFHQTAREILLPFGEELYELFTKNAKEYFYIPHRNKERGVGGLFFDHFKSKDSEQDLAMWKAIGKSLIPAIMPIYNQRVKHPFTEEEREIQLKMRGHYVEFNLLYDRGTKFGFRSNGNPEAILCSMPPLVKW